MGYAGYTAAKLPPPLPSAVQSALWAVPSQESLEIIEKLTKNVAVNPTEEKFKRIRLTNSKIKAALVDVPGAVEALLALGWARDEDEEALVVPKGRYFSMAEVRLIDEARDRLRKRERDAARTKPSRNPSNEATAQIRAQMEADRRERAAKEPVTKGSVAQKLGSGSAMMATPKDIGCTDC
ncbi:probable plant UBX domain-containing protein 2 at N-terminal half [Coccomyxa sp. Obi]|nr:probable plant UBX domain-containing protein 2 at N-terminal half [Coccomyxa sp. Obi]